jgi:hypothetical protein
MIVTLPVRTKFLILKNIFLHIIFFCLPIILAAQKTATEVIGSVSFKTSKNIYVRFSNTEFLNVGDTLTWKKEGSVYKSLVIRQKSSTSCVTENILTQTPEIGQEVIFEMPVIIRKEEKIPDIPPVVPDIDPVPVVSVLDTIQEDPKDKNLLKKQVTNGRLTFSTNASVNPDNKNNFQRIRASVALNIQNIHKSDFSFQTYLTYRHRYGVDQSTSDFYDDFKVINMAGLYQPNQKFNVWLGRKNNNNIANLGAIDGIQGEYHWNKYSLGTFIGTRPDFANFTFNAKLPQIGLYIVRNDTGKKGNAQTSLAIAEQQNDFKTDRRFLYFQHNNNLVKNLSLFFSSELDLYKKINGEVSNKPQLTSIYSSLRYRVRKNLSLSFSYDNRRNVIYYESYQTFIDQLLAQETRQGLRLQAQYSPFPWVNINASAFYRYQGDKPNPTKNYVGNLNFSRALRKSTNVSLSYNHMLSYYFKGNIIGARISDHFMKGKLNAEIQYRNVNYAFFNSESTLLQHIFGINFSMNLLKNTTLMCSYEGTMEPSKIWHRYFITISQRFKN